MTDGTRWAWARLNADTLFLVLIATFSGIFDMYEPTRDDVTAAAMALGEGPYPLHYVRAAAYLIAGLALLLALLWSSIRIEVVARCVLVSAVLVNVGRHGFVLGWDSTETVAQWILLGVLTLVTVLRFSVLLDNRGIVVTKPASSEEGR